MSLYTTLRGWFGGGGGATSQQSGVQRTEPVARVYEPSPQLDADGAMQVSAVWACVELIVSIVASLPLFVYRTKGGQRTLARGDALYTLLHDRPNFRHTSMEFWQFMLMNFLLTGNAYARLDRDDNGDVIQMWPLSSEQVTVSVMPDGSLTYAWQVDNHVAVYGEQAILHLRDMGNGVVGMSRMDYMRASLGVAVAAQNHQSRLYRRDGKRPGVFSIDKTLTETQRDAIRSQFAGLQEGSNTELLVLEAGAKFEPLALSPADAELMETRRFSVEEIARWFGVPSVLINDTANTSVWGTGISQIVEGFNKFRLGPLTTLLQQAIAARVLTPAQRSKYTVEFSLDALLRASLPERMEIYAKAVQNGLKTRNECRQLENDPPVEGADQLTAQTNLAPLDKLGATAGGGDVPQDPINQ